jgi:hypothetical protein
LETFDSNRLCCDILGKLQIVIAVVILVKYFVNWSQGTGNLWLLYMYGQRIMGLSN